MTVEAVPFRDTAARARRRSEAWTKALTETVETTAWSRPSRVVRALEEEIAERCGTTHAVATASGTAAVVLALLALELPRGAKVVAPALTFVTSAHVPRLLGLTVTLADVDRSDYLLYVAGLEKVVDDATRVVLPVHLYGRMANVPALVDSLTGSNAIVIEEACQAMGARWKGKPAGSLGVAGVFSFGREKAIASIGEGGAVVTSHDGLMERLRRYCNQGSSKDDYATAGLNLRMDPLQAAVIRTELSEVESVLQRREDIAQEYSEEFSSLGIVRNPHAAGASRHGWYLYVLEVDEREEFRRQLANNGIETKVHYRRPLHMWSAHRDLAAPGDFPEAERLADRVVSIPFHEDLSPHQVRHVRRCVVDTIERIRKS